MEKLQNETAMYTRLVYIDTVGHDSNNKFNGLHDRCLYHNTKFYGEVRSDDISSMNVSNYFYYLIVIVVKCLSVLFGGIIQNGRKFATQTNRFNLLRLKFRRSGPLITRGEFDLGQCVCIVVELSVHWCYFWRRDGILSLALLPSVSRLSLVAQRVHRCPDQIRHRQGLLAAFSCYSNLRTIISPGRPHLRPLVLLSVSTCVVISNI
jgi:hypothetical protein